MHDTYRDNPDLNEPFQVGRDESRLLFDIGIAFSCIKKNSLNNKILDFASGNGWIAEWLNRMGFDVVSCDILKKLAFIQKLRFSLDYRVNADFMSCILCDGGYLSFREHTFANIICFDALHHMKDYSRTLQEMYRTLIPGGRAIFIEPGAKHSTSKETIEFLATHKDQLGDNWIERDVILWEIYQISQHCGYREMIIKPFLLPSMVHYSFDEWIEFRSGHPSRTEAFFNQLMDFNHNGRVCFYLEK